MRSNKILKTPILFLIFNRPDSTQIVFNEIKKAKPAQLFVSADGPREGRPRDRELCLATREIIKQVDWDCEVYTKYYDDNAGLKIAVSTAIDWFFENVDAGIILEDDCLPSQSFFWFCQELLEKYHDDERIMQISGNNYLFGGKVFDSTYYFSRLNDIWGWATWKRAWDYYDVHMKTFPKFKEQEQIINYIVDPEIQEWLMGYFERDYNANERNGLWSSQWSYAICAQNGMTIAPSTNLVQNIGIQGEATNSNDTYKLYETERFYEIDEIIHPLFILPDTEADRLRFEIIKKTDPNLLYAAQYKLRKLAGRYLPESIRNIVKTLQKSLSN